MTYPPSNRERSTSDSMCIKKKHPLRSLRPIAKTHHGNLGDLHVCYEASGCRIWIARRPLQMGGIREGIAVSHPHPVEHQINQMCEEGNRRLLKLMSRHPGCYETITSGNGCEFDGYKEVETKISAIFYFATPHHSWERGTNENTNGLIRQYPPKSTSTVALTRPQCDRIVE